MPSAPHPRPAYPPGFLLAWQRYPHYAGRSVKAKAAKVWRRRGLESLTGSVLDWLEAFAFSPDWTKGGGEFVPGMQVWLAGPDFSEPAQVHVPVPQALGEHGRKTLEAGRRWMERTKGQS